MTEVVGVVVLRDDDLIKALSGDDGQTLINCIEDLQEITGATSLKITIEAYKE